MKYEKTFILKVMCPRSGSISTQKVQAASSELAIKKVFAEMVKVNSKFPITNIKVRN